ncbi:MAG: xanthine dehydrogenase family protein subunit, partial [Hyphomicrobiales bacterium]|nr:xanthine dehydrogenase family protein subunit [Hyphomicrobiales bacterium]
MAALEITEPEKLEDAYAMLGTEEASVRPMGGGTALMLMMKAQLFKPTRLVSLRKIEALSGFSLNADASQIRIGAMTTFSELENSPLIAQHLPV